MKKLPTLEALRAYARRKPVPRDASAGGPEADTTTRTLTWVQSYYTLDIKPLWRGTNKNAYEYEATVWERPRDRAAHSPRVIWRVVRPKRRDAKAEGDAFLKLQNLRLQEKQKAELTLPPGTRPVVKTSMGMAGRTHSLESRALMSAAIKAKHAAGHYKNCGAGRPTRARQQATLEAYARSQGITLETLLNRLSRISKK